MYDRAGNSTRDGDEVYARTPTNQKKVRGPYKQYLIQGSNMRVPESTIRSRNKAEERRRAQVAGQNVEVRQNIEVDVLEEDTVEQHDTDTNFSLDAAEAAPHTFDEVQPRNSDQTFSDEGIGHKQQVDYIKKYNLHGLLHRSCLLSKLDVLLMILHMSTRHCHTQPFIEDIIRFVNALFGEPVLDVSYHIFSGLFPSSSSIVKYYFCPDCEVILGSETELVGLTNKVCERCKNCVCVKSSTNFFISLSLREQIKTILERPDVKLVDRTSRNVGNVLADIFDGELYNNVRKVAIPIDRVLTITANTDGVRVHESTKNTMYPVLAHLNELIPEVRFKPDNVLLAGLWFGRSAPSMAMFLKPFTDQMLNLAENGVTCITPDSSTVTYHVFPLAFSVDSVAKPKVVCQKQFNGRSGCLYCVHPNDTTIEGFPPNQRFYDTSVAYPLRSEEEVIADMLSADEKERRGVLKDDSVNGFLGLSVLLAFTRLLDLFSVNTFHIVWSTVIDYMHNALEGVTADLLDLYLGILTSAEVDTLNKRINKITPPQAMTRKPRLLSDKIHWKAKEYRSFLLYYSIPCLQDLLPQRHLTLLKVFVNAMHILLSDNITSRAFLEAKSALSDFVIGFQRLYGLQCVTYNLHLLTHLCDLVLRLGPIWCYSNFVFESANGRLVRLIRGTKSIIIEIAKKFTKLQGVPKIIFENPVSVTAIEFCNYVSGYKYSKSGTDISDVFLTGSHSIVQVTEIESDLLSQHDFLMTGQEVKFYNRVIRNGIIFCSKSYLKTKMYDDSCVQLLDGRFAVLDKILTTKTNEVVCLIFPLRIAGSVIPPIQQCSRDCFCDAVILPFKDILRKCVLVSVDEKNLCALYPIF